MRDSKKILLAGSALVAGGLSFASKAHAQVTDPDLRNVPPAVFLLVDTSGSMERMPTCVCTTASCEECLPSCAGAASEKNRWTLVLEALTGSWSAFSCTTEARSLASYATESDYNYFIPFHRPPSSAMQGNDGILDVYSDRVRFGLMTFDGVSTLTTDGMLVPRTTFEAAGYLADSATALGQYSYGDRKAFSLPGCATEYMIDNGAQSENATSGPLVSIGTPSDDPATINAAIQTALLSARPFGPTPIAGMLDDFRYYLQNDPEASDPGDGSGDGYYSCRKRYALLLTDGYPSAEMRDGTFNCEQMGGACPYDTSEEIAADLCQLSGEECTGTLDGLGVVGFNVTDDAATVDALNDIAAAGGTGAALFADDRASLVSALAEAIDAAAPGTTTRTVPAFVTGGSSGARTQLEFRTGFELIDDTGASPWAGRLDRVRYACDADLNPVAQAVTDEDEFHTVLNNRATSRNLLTVVPADAASADDTIIGEDADVEFESFATTNPNLTESMLDVSTSSRAEAIINWVHGTDRAEKLGDIYHSSPIIVGVPEDDLPDESYNQWRQLPDISSRPRVLYVGTNDGVIHAFAVEDHVISVGTHAGESVDAGEELWGFVPPILFSKLDEASTTHQVMADGTPTVRNVYLSRSPNDATAAAAERWRTVLVTGFRNGARGYEAIDVTDPLAPKFLWQFSDPDMGYTVGRPTLAQALIEYNGTLQERAIAILPGGTGSIDAVERAANPTGCAWTGAGAPAITTGTSAVRSTGNCWAASQGRQLYIVDVETGDLLAHIDEGTFNSPVTGGASVFLGDSGTVATRFYVTDQDGVMWRVDLTSSDPDDWDNAWTKESGGVAPMHDLFWDEATGVTGQPGFEPPVVTTDPDGNVVILQATGDIDNITGSYANRVASLKETLMYDDDGALDSVGFSLNWQQTFDAGEQVTGALELFNGNVYFASFKTSSSATDLCEFGESKIWGLDYLENNGDAVPAPVGALETSPGSGSYSEYLGPYSNRIVMGVGITQRLTCFEGEDGVADPFFGYGTGSRYRVTDTGGGAFELVAQVAGVAATDGSIATITRQLESPPALTSVRGIAGNVD